MTNHLHQSLLPALMCALLSVLSLRVAAQDVTFDLSTEATSSGDITLTYCPSNITPKGASIYYASSDFYSLKIKSSNRSIAHVEFIGKATSSTKNGNLEVAYGNGTLSGSSDAIMYWAGNSTNIQIWGMDSNTGYVITKLRIWYTGSAYTPSTEWNDTEEDAKVALGGSPKNVHYYAHPKTLPAEGRGVPMAFVYPTKFREALLDYMEWKTQQGYEVMELCVDDVVAETGKSDDDLALELRSRLMAMQPRPVYVLLCGDTPEVPAFKHRTQRPSIGIDPFSDFFYGEYTGDFFAEAYVGRFSASNVEDLQPQMEKTKYMAMIDPAEAGWLSHSLVVHSPASNITTEPAANFGKAFPLQWEGNTTDLILYASKTEQINQQIDGGCSQVAYVGHGDWDKWFDGWGQTNYTMDHAKQLKNKNKYPVVLGLTCLSGRYQSDCLAETFMRLKDAGAVAYFGASRESWDVSDNAFFTGGDGFNKTFQHIGYMRSLYHPLEEDESQLSRTIGEAFYIGKFSDRYLGELSPHRQFVELYNLFGDPTYQPYITVPKQMFATPSANAVAAGHAVSITTAPEAVVCISQGRHIVTAGVADKQGKLTLKLPVDAPVGECVLYASAPFYNDLKSSITVTEGDAAEDHLAPATKLPHVQYADVVDVHTAASALTNAHDWPGSQPAPFSVSSTAKYTMCASTNLNPGNFGYDYADWNNKNNDTLRAFYLRNKYDQCSFITTESAGQAAYVSVDWLNPYGQAEILGVYGKTTPYVNTTDAWNSNKGQKLGEIRKGQSDYLLIEGNWPYIMVRAEDYETSAADQNDVFLKSLTIGWNRLKESEPIRTITIPEFGGTTLALQDAYTMPKGVRGMIVSAQESESHAGEYDIILTTKYQSGDVVPAGECLVLKGAPGSYGLISGTTEAVPTTYPANLLRADYKVSGSKYLTNFYNYASAYERYYYYKLTTNEGSNFGWYHGAEDGAPFLMSCAERAYLVLDREIASSVRSFNLDDCSEEQTTGIGVLSSMEGQSTNACYDLYGRSYVRQPKSTIVIQGGKKVIK